MCQVVLVRFCLVHNKIFVSAKSPDSLRNSTAPSGLKCCRYLSVVDPLVGRGFLHLNVTLFIFYMYADNNGCCVVP